MADCVTGQLGNNDGQLQFPPGGLRPKLLGRLVGAGGVARLTSSPGPNRSASYVGTLANITGEWEAFVTVTNREGYVEAQHSMSINVYRFARATVNGSSSPGISDGGGSLIWSIGAGGMANTTITRYQPYTQVDLPLVENDDDDEVITRLHDGDVVRGAITSRGYTVTDNNNNSVALVTWPTSFMELWGWPVND